MLEQAHTARVLVLLTFRPEFAPPWGSRAHLTQITLNRLPRRLTADMLDQLTGGKEVPKEVVTQIATKSDGVPLFVEELTHTVMESGLLLETEGRYELHGPLPELAIPSTLQDSLTARLDRLSSVRESIQLAAVLGKEFNYELIRAVSPLEEVELAQHLEHLVTSEFLYQRGLPPESTYIFKHSLIQDAAYNSLLITRRQQYHQQAARSLEQIFPRIAEIQPEMVAHHFAEGGVNDKAATYWRRAGERSLGSYSHEEALNHFRRAIAAKEPDPMDSEKASMFFGLGRAQAATRFERRGEESIASLRQAFDYFAESGNIDQAVAVAESALHSAVGERTGTDELATKALLLTPPDSYHAGRLLSTYARVLGLEHGDHAGALDAFDRALTIAKREAGPALEMRTLANAARVNYFHLNSQEAVDQCRKAILLSQQTDEPESEITAYHYLSTALWHFGNIDEAKQIVTTALSVAEKLRDSFWLSGALWMNGASAYSEGDWAAARELSNRGLDVAPTDSRSLLPRILLEYETGNFRSGEEFLERLLSVANLTSLEPTFPHVPPAMA